MGSSIVLQLTLIGHNMVLLGRYIYSFDPVQAKQVREVANLTERKNPVTFMLPHGI